MKGQKTVFRVEIKRAGQNLETLASADYLTRSGAFSAIGTLAESAGVEVWSFGRGMISAFNIYGVESSNSDAVIYLTEDFEYAAHVTGVE